MTLLLAFLIGFLAGLRSLTPPAAVAWAAHLGWLKLSGLFAPMGSMLVVAILTLLATGELIADKLPRMPRRTLVWSLLFRIVMGKRAGTCLAVAAGQSLWIGAAGGAIGAIVGTYCGYYVRRRAVATLRVPDWSVALIEDLVVLVGVL